MNLRNMMSAALRVTACLVVALVLGAAQAQAPAKGAGTNPDPDLVGKLTKELNVTPKQAIGGAGAIFGLAKSRLNPAEFSKLATVVPGTGGFLKAAPASQSGSRLGSLGSVVPGGAGGAGGAGGLMSLAGSFQSLGLSPGMASNFVPIIQNHIASKGGSGAAALFANALK